MSVLQSEGCPPDSGAAGSEVTMKHKTHKVEVTIRFDKPVTKAAALRAAKNGIHGEIYATIAEHSMTAGG